VWLDITLPERAYTGAAPKLAFFDEVLRRTHTVPGVESASVVQGRPLGGGNSVATVAPEGALPAEGEQAPRVPFHVVASGYFEALRIPRLEGRDFAESDRASSPRVAAVSRAFAKKFWPGQSAVGKRFWMGRVAADAPLTEVVGVVEDVRQYGLGEEPIPMVYRALAQVPRASATLVIRHDGRSLADAIEQTRSTIWSLDSALPLDRAGTMDAQVSESIREPRFRAIALSAFGLLACVIACVGLYGALAWLVRARSREFGVRAALGASPDELRGLIVRRGLTLAGAGIALGLIAASFAAGFLSSMVFGISPTDAPTFAVAAVTMVLVAFAACWIPARRAASVNPHVILRD
jgi:predicted permease